MISKEMIDDYGLIPEDHLRIINTISKEIEYMRLSLIPSLVKNIKDNLGKRELLKFFEIAKVYLPRKNDLPNEIYKLAISVNTDYFELKGIIEALYHELHIETDVSEEIIKKDNVFVVEIDLQKLIDKSKNIAIYKSINPYAVIKLDLTLAISKKLNFANIKSLAFKTSKLLKNIKVTNIFQNKITIRFYFSSIKENITEKKAKEELKKICHHLKCF
jgi:phenylalanyl-tRNA synthetase beta chain